MRSSRGSKLVAGVAGLACVLAVATTSQATIIERVVAIVGERPILLTDLRKRARPYLLQIFASSQNQAQRAAQESDMYRELLNRMVDERLEEQAADKARLSVTADEIDRGLKNKADSLGLKVGDLLAEARRQGLVESEYRDEVRRQLLEGKLIQLRVMNRVRVSDEDARSEYAKWVRQVGAVVDVRLLARQLAPGLTAQQLKQERDLTEEILRKARAGADFCELVKTYSQNVQTRQNCGATGPQPIASLLPPIAAGIEKLPPMGISEVIEFPDQALIIAQLARAPYIPAFEEVKALMQEQAMGAVIDRQRKLWLQELRRGVYIDIRL